MSSEESDSPRNPDAHCPNCGAAVPPDSTACPYCETALLTNICANCFRSIAFGAGHCSHCGAKIISPPKVEPKKDLVCPRCDGNLEYHNFGHHSNYSCTQCGGVWLSDNDFYDICMDENYQDALLQKIPPDVLLPEPGSKPIYIPCPECRTLIVPKKPISGSNIIIYQCRNHGIWLDRQELQQIGIITRKDKIRNSREKELRKRLQQTSEEAEPRVSYTTPAPPNAKKSIVDNFKQNPIGMGILTLMMLSLIAYRLCDVTAFSARIDTTFTHTVVSGDGSFQMAIPRKWRWLAGVNEDNPLPLFDKAGTTCLIARGGKNNTLRVDKMMFSDTQRRPLNEEKLARILEDKIQQGQKVINEANGLLLEFSPDVGFIGLPGGGNAVRSEIMYFGEHRWIKTVRIRQDFSGKPRADVYYQAILNDSHYYVVCFSTKFSRQYEAVFDKLMQSFRFTDKN